MKSKILLLLGAMVMLVANAWAQCPQVPQTNITTVPDFCTNALNIVPYVNNCQNVCVSNVGAAATSTAEVSNQSCFGGSTAHDIYFTVPYPYGASGVPNYDGSLVFNWLDWPNKASGAAHPNMSIHVEIAGVASGIINIPIDCTSPAPTQSTRFASENVICVSNTTTAGNQFYAPAGTIPLISQISQPGVTINNMQYWMQVAPSDGGQGNICFDVSPYKRGFLCGDATPITLNTNTSGALVGSISDCLCSTALNGTLTQNTSNVPRNLPVPCGVETPSSGWYAITLPYACNKVSLNVSQWGGTGNYNLALLSGVSCPGTTGTNAYTGQPVLTPGQTLQPGAVIEAGACSQPLNLCRPLAAGTYYVYISGANEKPTFTLDVTVTDATASVGTVTSTQNNQNVCSGSNVELISSGAVLPLAASCGQNMLWYIGTSLNFNPYNGQGTLLATGTGTLTAALPVNNNCTSQIYYIKGILSDNGTTPVASCRATTSTITVTVYPAIGLPTVSNQPCIITVAGRCPSFTVNGTAGSATYLASFADDGTQQNFVISNGLAACNVSVTETVSCSGNCTQPSATASTACNTNDPFNFYVNVNVSQFGSASSYTISASDGSARIISATGTYQVGPFTNGTSVTLTLTNTEDVNCNLPLGNFTSSCNPVSCPNLTSAVISVPGGGSTAYEGQSGIILQATVNQGIINQDYSIQWYKDGIAIPGATTPVYSYVPSVTQGCQPEVQGYSVKITCLLPNATPSSVTQLNTSPANLTVYPIPDFGVDFVPSTTDCTVAPLDLCGGLNITYTPTTNPAAGSGNTTVNYTVSVPGAPAAAVVTGSYVVQCPSTSCQATAGNGTTPADNKICFGGSFDVTSAGTNVPAGWALGYAWTTTNPYSNLAGAVQSALSANHILGPFTAGQTLTYTNDGSVFPTNGKVYFIPFTSLNVTATNQFAYQNTGTQNFPFGGSSQTKTITLPTNFPYCSGLTTFNVTLTANQTSGIGNPINNAGGILPYTGGATTSLNLSNGAYTGNPNGANQTINGSSTFGANISYNFNIRHSTTYPFPTVCPSCNDVGNPVVVELLPSISLTPAPALTVCTGSSVNLTLANPTANISGTYRWYDGNPTAGGTLLTNTVVTPVAAGSTYYAEFRSSLDSTCTAQTTVTITPTALPTVNTIPTPAPLCAGDIVNLNSLNSSITTAPGTFTWFRGNPQTGAAVQLPNSLASAQQPTDGQTYCCRFTSNATGNCTNYACVTYTVNPRPALTPPLVNPSVCQGSRFNLHTLEAGLTSAAGQFVWYQGSPSAGGTLLTNAQASIVTPTTANSQYCTVFTDNATGCTNTVCISITVNPLPTLNNLPQQGPICSGDSTNLNDLNPQLTSQSGSFDWYIGDPDNGGTLISNPTNFFPVANQTLYCKFTTTLTGCSAKTSVAFTVRPIPTLNAPVAPTVCSGVTVNLTDLEPDIITGPGFNAWYNGDPNNGGVFLSSTQAQSQAPTQTRTYYFTQTNSFGCTAKLPVVVTVNPSTPLTPIPTQTPQCYGTVVNLTDFQAGMTTANGQFAWYNGTTLLTAAQAAAQQLTTGVTYTARFTSPNGCVSSANVTYTTNPAVTGATASYNCSLNLLQVDLATVTGGSGSGYTVSTNSPNQNGQTLANGASWTVLVADGIGCEQAPITGTVSCVSCDAGTGGFLGTPSICCNANGTFTLTGSTLLPNHSIAWAITPQSAGPVTSEAQLLALPSGRVILGDANGGLTYTNTCALPNGDYYFTPVVVNSPNVPPLVYDTLNGCRPDGQICPVLSYTGTAWEIDTLFVGFPDGSRIDITQALIGQHLPINSTILTLLPGGVIPCLNLTTLYQGNPNGTWSFTARNIGTDPVSVAIPAFQVGVSATDCAALGGVDQFYTIPAVSSTINPGTVEVIEFQIPPGTNFPSVDAGCTSFGTPVLVNLCPLGTENVQNLQAVSVFPNPTDGTLNVTIDASTSESTELFLNDALGRLVKYQDLGIRGGRTTQVFGLEQLPQGIYILTVKVGTETRNLRVVKN